MKKTPNIAFAIIVESTLYTTNVLKEFNLDKLWLSQALNWLGIKEIEKVFFTFQSKS
ncbi:hypothetical protein [Gracilibacillus suaedae]|uniref:hypothetical protein n=1 Tax=Gracilibacillus suaedae TaxID=2820273 RepID=UPI001ABECEEE|nr:hypothetical protein [Gracilibacillus suaedae]